MEYNVGDVVIVNPGHESMILSKRKTFGESYEYMVLECDGTGYFLKRTYGSDIIKK